MRHQTFWIMAVYALVLFLNLSTPHGHHKRQNPDSNNSKKELLKDGFNDLTKHKLHPHALQRRHKL